MTILKENRVLLAKLETTVGTPIALADADGVFCAYDVEISPNIDFQQRDQQGGMSQLEGKTGSGEDYLFNAPNVLSRKKVSEANVKLIEEVK